jgi:hypothetical protein
MLMQPRIGGMLFLGSLLCCLSPGLASGQPADRLIKNYSEEDFQQFLRQNNLQNQGPFHAEWHPDKQPVLMFSWVYPVEAFKVFQNNPLAKEGDLLDMLDRVNMWNRAAYYSRAWAFPQKQKGRARFFLRIEGSLNISAGATPGQVQAYYDRLRQEHDQLVQKLLQGFRPQPQENP